MAYLFIFFLSYLVAFVAILIWGLRQNRIAAARLSTNRVAPEQIAAFHKQAMPLVLLIRPTLFIGSIGGCLDLLSIG